MYLHITAQVRTHSSTSVTSPGMQFLELFFLLLLFYFYFLLFYFYILLSTLSSHLSKTKCFLLTHVTLLVMKSWEFDLLDTQNVRSAWLTKLGDDIDIWEATKQTDAYLLTSYLNVFSLLLCFAICLSICTLCLLWDYKGHFCSASWNVSAGRGLSMAAFDLNVLPVWGVITPAEALPLHAEPFSSLCLGSSRHCMPHLMSGER